MSWFRIFTAVLAALIVFSVGMTLVAMLASWQIHSDESGPPRVRVETGQPPPRQVSDEYRFPRRALDGRR